MSSEPQVSESFPTPRDGELFRLLTAAVDAGGFITPDFIARHAITDEQLVRLRYNVASAMMAYLSANPC